MLPEIKYFPVLKTTQSELRALKHVDDSVKNKIMPIIELTAFGKHKSTLPEGSKDKALKAAVEAVGDHEFILDITSEDLLKNSELEEMYLPDNGYQNWVNYITSLSKIYKVSPVILLNLDGSSNDITSQVQGLGRVFERIYLRLPVVDLSESDVVTIITSILLSGFSKKISCIIDLGYIGQNKVNSFFDETVKAVNLIKVLSGINKFIVISSSFPKSVGNAETGIMRLDEVNILDKLRNEMSDITWIQGDYATIHPVRYLTKGGAWVPRIDVPQDKSLFFYRYRRDEGGYAKAASFVVRDGRFNSVYGCWGTAQILKASEDFPTLQGKPTYGLNPSFWISVRANMHIEKQVSRIYS